MRKAWLYLIVFVQLLSLVVAADSGLVLWNKLGSAEEVQNSEIGPGMQWLGVDNGYLPSKFSNGADCTSGEDNFIAVSMNSVIDYRRFTIEWWVTYKSFTLTNGVISPGYQHHITWGPKTGTDVAPLAVENGSNMYSVYWGPSRGGYLARSGEGFDLNAMNAAIDSTHHWAFVYDEAGIDGTVDNFRIYFDGAPVFSKTNVPALSEFPSDYVFAFGNLNGNSNIFQLGGILDNVKIWNYAKTDFSDRNNESAGAEQPVTPSLVLWNKLGSNAEVEHSEIGPNGIATMTDGSGYANAKFDQGFSVSSTGTNDAVRFENISVSNAGCVEFWWIAGEASSDTASDKKLFNIEAISGGYQFLELIKQGENTWWLNLFNSSNIETFNSPIYAPGDLMHIAVVWDDNKISGSDDYGRVYVDGVVLYHGTVPYSNRPTVGSIGIGSDHRIDINQSVKGIYDNIKVWNFAKTDFSDRFTEGNAGSGPVPTISLFKKWGIADDIGTFIVKRGASEGTATEIGKLKLNVAAMELTSFAAATTEDMESMITMAKTPEGKPMVTVTGSLAEEINSANAAAPKSVWVTASFTVDRLYPIILNGDQMSDSKGNVFPQYANYLGDVTYNAGEMTFRIYHFSEWSIPQLEAKAFAGTHDDDSIVANGFSIEVLAGGTTLDAGDAGQDTTTPVEKISGLAYATVLNDIQKVGDIYKPMDPSDTNYSVHFGYINRGNATDNFGIVAEMVSDNEGHFGYTIAVDNKDVAPWQIVSFSIDVNNAAALAFERATLNVTVNIVGDAVSYNAYAGAVSTTFGEDGVYGGLDDLSYAFTFETEGYSLKVLNRVATINSPLSDGQFIPGAKIKYEIVIKNESAAVATDVRIKDVIPANTHLYYLDGVTENQNVIGALNDVWSILSVTDNSAADVEYQFSIPANETVTASYTVTVD